MSAYPPPKEDLPVFNASNFEYADEGALTYESAKNYFLTYPTAQGTEYFLDANVANRMLIGGEIEFGDGTIQTTAAGASGIIPTLYAYSFTSSIEAPLAYLNFDGSLWGINDFFTLEVSIQALYATNQTCVSFIGYIDIYPNRVPSNSGYVANVNNEINGNSDFIYTNPTYAPNGRYYYSHGFSLQGFNDKIYIYSTNQSQIAFYILNPFSPQSMRVGLNIKVCHKGVNASPITVSGLTSFLNYNSVNF